MKLTTRERELPSPLIATHDASVEADFTGTTESETYAPPPGVKVLAAGRSGLDFVVPIAASVPITVADLRRGLQRGGAPVRRHRCTAARREKADVNGGVKLLPRSQPNLERLATA